MIEMYALIHAVCCRNLTIASTVAEITNCVVGIDAWIVHTIRVSTSSLSQM